MKQLIRYIRYLIGIRRLNHAISLADKAHKRSMDRYYVIIGEKKSLCIVSEDRIRGSKKTTKNRTMQESFYFTNCRNCSGALSAVNRQSKRENFLRWYL